MESSQQTRKRGGRSAHDKPGGSTAKGEESRDEEKKKTRTSGGLCKFILVLSGATVLLAAIVVYLLPSPIEPVAFSLPPPPEWTGPLAPNDKLSQAERVFENQLKGPESIVTDGEYIYTGTADGRVVRIHKGKIRTLARFGKGTDCGSFASEPTCGRPLGMRLDKDGYLLVADGYLGIYRVNVTSGDVHQMLSSQEPLAGHKPKLLNDIEEGPDRTIYFTDSSTRWDRRHNRYCIFEGEASGRLLSYDPATMEVQELLGGIAFANGVAISYDKTHILVVETTKARIWRYYLTGPRKGEAEIFAENLPGFPDNIRRSGRGTYWVGIAVIRKADRFPNFDFLAPRPWLRSLFAKLFPQELIVSVVPKYGLIIEMNEEGEIIRSLHDPTGTKVPATSEGEEKDGVLYMGSYNLPFLSRVSLHQK
ncbi:adipocyte plasma membrane-associated protein-like [Babylonia areolata]|uniref:adipocyte plasma membrane-associated protein-like n=1 Tax=Babylonia areolata TaxID=304850 RepID=UPI003FD51619